MLIRYGYAMTFVCSVPTPMVCQLDVHPSSAVAVRAETPFAARPHVESWLYADVFGNRCRRFNAPAGDLTISNFGVIEVSGLPDPVIPDAAEIPVADLPDDTLLYLLGSRYVETDKLSQIAWDLFGHATPGWPRVQAICDFVNRHIAFGYESARATRTAYEAYAERVGVPRLRASRGRVLPLHEHSGALLQRISRRHRRAARPSTDGFQCLVRRVSRRQVADLRCAPQHAAYWPHPNRARTRRRRYSACQLVWPAHPQIVPRVY